jgi:hypothetical protein
MTTFDKVVIKVARALGARLFKRYWPVRGSYWNRTHLNKTSEASLRIIIDESYTYTNHHVNELVQQGVVMGIVWYSDSQHGIPYLKIFVGMGIIHAYAILMHTYNRILALYAIDEIKRQRELQKKDDEPKSDDSFLLMSTMGSGAEVYYISCSHYPVSPIFDSKKMAEEYGKYLREKYTSRQEIFDAMYAGEMPAVYKNWRDNLNIANA